MQDTSIFSLSHWLNSLLNKEILEWSLLKAFADNKLHITKNWYFSLERYETIVGEDKLHFLKVFSPFAVVFSEGLCCKVSLW